MSFWSAIARGVEKVFGVATAVAQIVEPEVALLAPGIYPLWANTVNAAIKAEAVAKAAGAVNGTGAQKLAMVVKEIEGVYNDYAKANGVTPVQADVDKWVNAVVATLNSLPQPTAGVSVNV